MISNYIIYCVLVYCFLANIHLQKCSGDHEGITAAAGPPACCSASPVVYTKYYFVETDVESSKEKNKHLVSTVTYSGLFDKIYF